MTIGVVNYGIGNLRSVANALEQVGARFALIDAPGAVADVDKLLVPGVGAFGACMTALVAHGFREPVLVHAAAGKPLLGICVGLQMLADIGTEFGERPGLGLVPGRVDQREARADLLQRGRDRAQVADAVVHDADRHRACGQTGSSSKQARACSP